MTDDHTPEKSDDLVVVCLPVSSMAHPVRGSRVAQCERCGEAIWLSPSSVRVTDVGTLLCITCAVRAMRTANETNEPVTFMGLVPGQLDELTKHLEEGS